MFKNLFMNRCSGDNLFGYMCVAAGAEYRQAMKESRGLRGEEIFSFINAILVSKRLSTNNEQNRTIARATLAIERAYASNDAEILPLVKALAGAQSEAGFDFAIPEVPRFRSWLERHMLTF